MACEQLFLFISFITCLLVLYHIALNFIALEKIEKNFFPAHSTTEKRETMLTKTDAMKTTIMITKQQITEQNNTTGIYNIKLCMSGTLCMNLYDIRDIHFSIFVWFIKTINRRNKINDTCYHYITPL